MPKNAIEVDRGKQRVVLVRACPSSFSDVALSGRVSTAAGLAGVASTIDRCWKDGDQRLSWKRDKRERKRTCWRGRETEG